MASFKRSTVPLTVWVVSGPLVEAIGDVDPRPALRARSWGWGEGRIGFAQVGGVAVGRGPSDVHAAGLDPLGRSGLTERRRRSVGLITVDIKLDCCGIVVGLRPEPDGGRLGIFAIKYPFSTCVKLIFRGTPA